MRLLRFTLAAAAITTPQRRETQRSAKIRAQPNRHALCANAAKHTGGVSRLIAAMRQQLQERYAAETFLRAPRVRQPAAASAARARARR